MVALILSSLALAANDFPYSNIILRFPGQEDPFPGMGTGFASLSDGISTALWNPAGLMRTRSAEFDIGTTTTAPPQPWNPAYQTTDTAFNVGTGNAGFTSAILYTGDLTANTLLTRDWTGHVNYASYPTGSTFKQAIRVGNNFAFGVTSRGETGAALDLSGTSPLQYKTDIDLYNITDFMGSGISVDNNGFLTYSFNSGGLSYTYTSSNAASSDFLRQTRRIPFETVSDSHNDLNVQSNLTLSGAAKWEKLSVGVNVTPLSATYNIDNTVRMLVKSDTADPFFYLPNFDPNNQADVADWMSNESRYKNINNGYNKRYIRIPAGESVLEARYKGFFTASAQRIDVGMIYDFSDTFSIGASIDNATAAELDFKGSGLVSYVQSRVSTAEVPALLDPASAESYSPFTDIFSPMAGTEGIGLATETKIPLPQRVKIGATLRRPFLITLDYEQQNNPITVRYQKEDNTWDNLVISNIRLVRGGMETQLLMLPIWLRGGLTVMIKPTLTGADAKTQDSFNNAFKLRVLPLKLDLGGSFKVREYEIGGATGFSATSFTSMIQLDTLSSDFGRAAYYNLFFKSAADWSVTYQNTLDPAATGAAYSAASNKNDYLSIAKWISTVTISVRF
ncbi:hypothetical protein HZC35_07425 [Candidatus Saganbacteria bacterium]|nr:hypothetical protein [Candidatus Saganbacteria bacterium]